MRLDRFKDCIRLKCSLFEQDLLKPSLYYDVFTKDSTCSLLLGQLYERHCIDHKPIRQINYVIWET